VATEAVLLIGAIGAIAYTIRGITGAASAIVFNALFALAISVGLAGGMSLLDGLYWVALADLLAATTMLGALRRSIVLEPFLLRFIVVGLPVNVACTAILPSLALPVLGLGLGVALLASGVYLAGRQEIRTIGDVALRRWALVAGIGAGALGGLYGMAGPISVLFVSHAGGDPAAFRRRVTLLSAVWSPVRVTVLFLSGAYDATALGRFAATVPFILAGLALGFWAHRLIPERPFRVALGALVGVAGIVTLGRFLGP
jgi:uncharacterized membrane protein YfcA